MDGIDVNKCYFSSPVSLSNFLHRCPAVRNSLKDPTLGLSPANASLALGAAWVDVLVRLPRGQASDRLQLEINATGEGVQMCTFVVCGSGNCFCEACLM